LGKIFPEELTQRIKKIFLNLRYSGIKDEVINMMIDFTLNKCHNLQSEYINKISNTIKAKGLNTIEKLYDHLTFKSNKNNEFIDKNYLVINKNIDW
jgi:replication initiation and membrane attachment protein DnaB